MDQQGLFDHIRTTCATEGVDPDLGVAIAMQESGALWPNASSRYEPNFSYPYQPEVYASKQGITLETEISQQKTSWGPMHVMGAVARELGYNGPLPALFSIELGCLYGIKKLKLLLKKYGNETSAIAAYNAGSPRKKITSPGVSAFVNQEYVDSVCNRLKRLRQLN